MEYITLESALAACESAIARKPKGYIYTNESGVQARPTDENGSNITCEYAHRDKDEKGFFESRFVPGCLVGDVLFQHGASLSEMKTWGSYIGNYIGSRYGIYMDEDAEQFLANVQILQDRGTPWREAVDTVKAQIVEK